MIILIFIYFAFVTGEFYINGDFTESIENQNGSLHYPFSSFKNAFSSSKILNGNNKIEFLIISNNQNYSINFSLVLENEVLIKFQTNIMEKAGIMLKYGKIEVLSNFYIVSLFSI